MNKTTIFECINPDGIVAREIEKEGSFKDALPELLKELSDEFGIGNIPYSFREKGGLISTDAKSANILYSFMLKDKSIAASTI